LSEHTSAFSSEYRERLANAARTAWAQGLDEWNLATLLWAVDEYGIRVNSSCGPDGGDYPPPIFDGDPEIRMESTPPFAISCHVQAASRQSQRDQHAILRD
jgi:hypothetical protein